MSGRRTIPIIERWGGVRAVQRRLGKSERIESAKEQIAEELIDIASANLNDVVEWSTTSLTLRDLEAIPDAAKKAIRKVKVTPTKFGPCIEVELHDKVKALQILAKAAGLLDHDDARSTIPAVIGIQLTPPPALPMPEVRDAVPSRSELPPLVDPVSDP